MGSTAVEYRLSAINRYIYMSEYAVIRARRWGLALPLVDCAQNPEVVGGKRGSAVESQFSCQ